MPANGCHDIKKLLVISKVVQIVNNLLHNDAFNGCGCIVLSNATKYTVKILPDKTTFE